MVGSSRNSTRGRCTSPIATSSLRAIPPEYVFARRSAASIEAEASRSARCARLRDALACHALDPTGQDEVLPAGGHRVAARTSATPGRCWPRAGLGSLQHVDAGDGGLPGIRAGQAGEDLARRWTCRRRSGPSSAKTLPAPTCRRQRRPGHGSAGSQRPVRIGLDEIDGATRPCCGHADMQLPQVWGVEAAAPIV